MRVAFAGTPGFAATVLRGLLDSKHEVGLVISQPDAPRGRGRRPTPTPVATLAREMGLDLRQPARISEAAAEISAHDALVVAAYGQILRPDTLYAARNGAFNVHASLLPKYRGAAPIERAIMAGETTTGVTIIKMDEGLDTGPMALQRETPIGDDMTGGELTAQLARLGSEAIVEVLSMVEACTLDLKEQDSDLATYVPKLEVEERGIRWDRSCEEVRNLVRALAPHIGARTFHPEVEGPIKVWKVRETEIFLEDFMPLKPGEITAANNLLLVGCADGTVSVERLQMPGKKALSAGEFLRGNELGGMFLY
jgi:methionyl-tRNA formyltransferase